MLRLCLTLFTFGVLLQTEAQDCTGLPEDSDVSASFNSLLINQGGEGGGTFIIGDGPFYTCKGQGSTMGAYREVSVVMTFTRNTAPSTILIRQFELDCTDSAANTWSDRSGSLSTPGNGFDYMNSLRTDCASCVTNSPPNENHCQPCDSACNSGLMRCTGSSNSDCCVTFDNGVCSVDLNCTETNFVANEQNNYTCACGLTCDSGYELNSTSCSCILTDTCLANSPCANGVCVLGSTPDQYTCNCTGTNFMGTNCSACGVTCGPGLVLNSTLCSCTLTDICQANSPCTNGKCVLGSTPDQYTCNCTGTNFVGMNCSDCELSCEPGFTLNTVTCSCELTNICMTQLHSCENGGLCVLESAPNEITCNCTGTNFRGPNCSVCNLTCSLQGYTLAKDSCTCNISDICVANTPCQNRGQCMLTTPPDKFQCDCEDTGFTGEQCSNISDICVANNPCQNGGQCMLTTPPDKYQCICEDTGFTGERCSSEVRGGDPFPWWWIVVGVVLLIILIGIILLVVIIYIIAKKKSSRVVSV